MQRLNGHHFYNLALRVHPLVEVESDSVMKEWFIKLWQARLSVQEIMGKIPLRTCRTPADKLVAGINRAIPEEWQDAVALLSSKSSVGVPAYDISEGAREFETVLEAESQNLDTYLVSQKGTYSTPDLIERAEIMFPESIRVDLPAIAVTDWREAGGCIAFDTLPLPGFTS